MPQESAERKKTPTKKQSAQRRSRKKVDQILDAARQILVDDGLEKLTTNHIAEEAGVSIGTVYQYYPNKQAILSDLCREFLDNVIEKAVAHTCPAEIIDPIERVECLFDNMAADWIHDSDAQRYEDQLTMAMRYYPELEEMRLAYRQEMLAAFTQQIESTGLAIEAADLKLLGLFIFELRRVMENLIYNEKYSHHEAFDWCKSIALFAVRQASRRSAMPDAR